MFSQQYTSFLPPVIQGIISKVFQHEPISVEEVIELYHKVPLSFLGMVANELKLERYGNQIFYNRNIHVEPTNVCVMGCKFCTYYRLKGEQEAWEYNHDDIAKILSTHNQDTITEVHIVGGVHPDYKLEQYAAIVSQVRKALPHVHIKAYTAVEIVYMAQQEKISYKAVLESLRQQGLDSLPGGGAEIFDEEVRKKICPGKATAREWLDVHRTAHELGIKSNATILYGHIETIRHRFEHMERLRALQQETGGFNAFIPLKYKIAGSKKLAPTETSGIDDLKMIALSRIFFHNIDHIKSYWPMFGKAFSQVTLSYGVDDLDGTIQDSTKIYTMSGVDNSNTNMTVEQMCSFIREVGGTPIERDSHYGVRAAGV